MNKKEKTVALSTLGCKVNQYDTAAVLTQFLEQGYQAVDFHTKADVYVINTCTVTNSGDRKSRQMIRRAHKTNPEAKIVVMGCLAQIAPQKMAEIEGVNLIVGTDGRRDLVQKIEALARDAQLSLVGDIFKVREFEELSALNFSERVRATLKIQDGCQQFCTYCRIPLARGPARSRSKESVLKEARLMIEAGFPEIVLTGIHLGLFGKDLNPPSSLTEISGEIADLPGLVRLRISSVDPREVTEGLLDLLAKHPAVCRHLHLPLQSGSDKILKRMKRNYSRADFLNTVQKVRQRIPEAALTTDIMVGFPGETEQDFAQTMQLVKAAGFSRVHVFRYSRRAGTQAAGYGGQIAAALKEKRSKRLIELSKGLARDFHLSFLGKEVEVLVEQVQEGSAFGLTDNYIRVGFPVESGADPVGKIVTVHLKSGTEDGVWGG